MESQGDARSRGAGGKAATQSGTSRLSEDAETSGGRRSSRGDDAHRGSKSAVVKTILQLKRTLKQQRQHLLKARFAANQAKIQAQLAYLEQLCNHRNSPPKDLELMLLETKEETSTGPSGEGVARKAIVSGSKAGETRLKPVKLPCVTKLPPPYMSWIFAAKNTSMTEHGALTGLRRQYYKADGETALVTDSEDEQRPEEDSFGGFSSQHCQVIWETVKEHGPEEEVFAELARHCAPKEAKDIEEKYKALCKEQSSNPAAFRFSKSSDIPPNSPRKKTVCGWRAGGHSAAGAKDWTEVNAHSHHSLEQAMDSVNKLFCRRCLVFDCRLHGINQPLTLPLKPHEKVAGPSEDLHQPCGPACYLLNTNQTLIKALIKHTPLEPSVNRPLGESLADVNGPLVTLNGPLGNVNGPSEKPLEDVNELVRSTAEGVQKGSVNGPVEGLQGSVNEHLESFPTGASGLLTKPQGAANGRSGECANVTQHSPQGTTEVPLAFPLTAPNKPLDVNVISLLQNCVNGPLQDSANVPSQSPLKNPKVPGVDLGLEEVGTSEICDGRGWKRKWGGSFSEGGRLEPARKKLRENEGGEWGVLEQEMFELAIKILGPYSCRIARFLNFPCWAIHTHLKTREEQKSTLDGKTPLTALACSSSDDEAPPKGGGGGVRRKGKKRKVAKRGWTVMSKKLAGSKVPEKGGYSPCSCVGECNPKTCSCCQAGTACEKYCGCPPKCKLRFPGCKCKHNRPCRTMICLCFRNNRECDPDICSSCGPPPCPPGKEKGPPQESTPCQNMQMLLNQHRRVLLGNSDVKGWGAFVRHEAEENDYLGEYTGELISHIEADRRGKMYDKQNLSFLFNLNDQYVLDAGRKGNKLKFANHSPTPNCYAKVKLVCGDHRVGIYASHSLVPGEEIFYDYKYDAETAPAWAISQEDLQPPKGTVPRGKSKKTAV